MIFPVFSLYASQLKYATATRVGIALGAYGLTQALLQIPVGFLSDRFGRKPVIMMGLVLLGVGSVLAACSETIYGVGLGRLLQGASAIGAVMIALVSDLTRPIFRTRARAMIGLSIGLSFSASMILGPLLSSMGGIQGIFWCTALFAAFAMLLLAYGIPHSEPVAPEASNIQFQSNTLNLKRRSDPKGHLSGSSLSLVLAEIAAIIRDPLLVLLNGAVFVLHASLVAIFLKIPAAVQQLGVTEVQSWHFYVPVFLCALFASIPWLMMNERLAKPMFVMCLAMLVLLLAECGLWLSVQNIWALGLSLGLFFMAFNVLEAGLPALVSRSAPSSLKGAALGAYSTAQFLGLFSGGLAGGWLDAHYGAAGIFYFCILLALGCVLGFYKQFLSRRGM